MILKTNGFRGVQFGGCPFIFRETLLLAVEAKPKAKLSLMRRIVSSVGLISHPWPRHISWKAPPKKSGITYAMVTSHEAGINMKN